jgi:hypothetical protein
MELVCVLGPRSVDLAGRVVDDFLYPAPKHRKHLIGRCTQGITHKTRCFQSSAVRLDSLADRQWTAGATMRVVAYDRIIAADRPVLSYAVHYEQIDLV